MKRSWFLTAAFIFSIMLSACGGGGGGNTNTSPSVPNDNGNTDTPPPVFSDYTSVAQGEDPPAPPVVVTPPVAPPVVPPADPPVIVVPPPDPDVPSGAWKVSGTTLGLSVFDGTNLHVINRVEQESYKTEFAPDGSVIKELPLLSNIAPASCRAAVHLNGYIFSACWDQDGSAWLIKTNVSSGATEKILLSNGGMIVSLTKDTQAGILYAIYEYGGGVQYLMKLDQNGEVLDAEPKPGSQFQMLHITTGNDYIYIAGRVMQSGSFDRIWVARYAKSDLTLQGSLQYRPFNASEGLDRTYGIATAPNGNVFVTGLLSDLAPGEFVATSQNIAFEINASTGSIARNWTAPEGFGNSPAFDLNGNLYSIDSKVYKFNPATGNFTWGQSAASGIYMTLVGDTIYAAEAGTPGNPNPSKITRIDTSTGVPK